MEMEALQAHLLKAHKTCPPLIQPSNLPDPLLPHLYLTDKRVTKEWQVHLWAQRTGELFLHGAQAWAPNSSLLPTTQSSPSPCPLCKKHTNNLSIHWFTNCPIFIPQYKLGAELLWQLMLNYLRHILYTTAPTHAIFSHLRDPQGPLAQAAQSIPSSRLHLFWFMDGLGTPSKHLIPFLVAMRHPYESLILDIKDKQPSPIQVF